MDNWKYLHISKSTLVFWVYSSFHASSRCESRVTLLMCETMYIRYMYACILLRTFYWTKFITREYIKWRNSNFWMPHENLPLARLAVYVELDLGQANECEQTWTSNLLQGVWATFYWNISKLFVRVCSHSFVSFRFDLRNVAVAIILFSILNFKKGKKLDVSKTIDSNFPETMHVWIIRGTQHNLYTPLSRTKWAEN